MAVRRSGRRACERGWTGVSLRLAEEAYMLALGVEEEGALFRSGMLICLFPEGARAATRGPSCASGCFRGGAWAGDGGWATGGSVTEVCFFG